MTEPETTEQIEEVERGYRLHVSSKRGTGTRDEDKVSATAKTESLEELQQDASALHSLVSQMMDNRRAHQPDEAEE